MISKTSAENAPIFLYYKLKKNRKTNPSTPIQLATDQGI